MLFARRVISTGPDLSAINERIELAEDTGFNLTTLVCSYPEWNSKLRNPYSIERAEDCSGFDVCHGEECGHGVRLSMLEIAYLYLSDTGNGPTMSI